MVAVLVIGLTLLTAGPAGAAPGNDAFAAATSLSGLSGTVVGTNVGATVEAGEPDHLGSGSTHSIWYVLTPSIDGRATVDTVGSTFDTILAAYTGAGVDALTLLAGNDDDGGSTSRVTFRVAAGTPYYLAVEGYGDATGEVTLNHQVAALQPPPNDNFSSAQVLVGTAGQALGTNVDAGAEPLEPNHAGYVPEASVWYRWTAATTTAAVLDTFTSDFDTVLAVYAGTALSDLTLVAENDQAGYYQVSRVQFPATAGTTYHIAVGGVGGAEGTISLNYGIGPARPDGRIRRGPSTSGSYVGNDRYNALAPQTVTSSVRVGRTATYTISVQNDALISDVLQLRGTGSTPRYSVVYRGWFNINVTAAVVNGTYTTPPVAPGGADILRAVVTVRPSAPVGSSFSATLRATSQLTPSRTDTVRFVTRRA